MKHLAVVALALANTACGTSASTAEFRVEYALDAADFAAAASTADRALRRCADFDGAEHSGAKLSNPPVVSVSFEGSATAEAKLEQCLRALPDTRVTKRSPTTE